MLYICICKCCNISKSSFVQDESEFSMTFVVQVIGEIEETVKTGCWVGDCFIYTNSVNRLNYYVGGEIVTIAHLDRFVLQTVLMFYNDKENMHSGEISLSSKELCKIMLCLASIVVAIIDICAQLS